jgi:hypothetical protein
MMTAIGAMIGLLGSVILILKKMNAGTLFRLTPTPLLRQKISMFL